MKKDASVSAIRLIAMLMIIVCHILQGLDNKWAYWMNVGVQIFFFISGFLYGKKEIRDTKDFYVKRFRRVFLPFLIVCVVGMFLELVVLKNNYPAETIAGDLLGFGGFSGLVPILTHTWFVSYILLCYILLPVFQNVFSGKNFRGNLIRLVVLMIFMQLLEEFSVIGIAAAWINNFVLGYFYSRFCNGGGEAREVCGGNGVATAFNVAFCGDLSGEVERGTARIYEFARGNVYSICARVFRRGAVYNNVCGV